MRGAVKNLVLAAAVFLLPSAAFAQATITGTARDSSNAVLPGVTDMRFAKIFRLAGRRADVGIDLYNIFNVNTPTGYEDDYDAPPAVAGGRWLEPTSIVQSRFARFNMTVSF